MDLCTHNSYIMTRINSLYVSQTSPDALCMQNNVISTRITSLYGYQPSSVVFARKTATFGSELQEICKILGITKTRTTPYHPQSDGMIERFNRTILNMLSTVVSDDEYNWDLHLPTLMLAYHTSRHETTGATPFSLVYGREAKLPEYILFNSPTAEKVTTSHGYAEALKERIQQAYPRVRDHSAVEQRKQKANYDQLAQASTFETGCLVWLHCPAVPRGKSPKFHRPWQGPFKVVKKIGSVYRIQHLQNTRKRLVVHSNRLKNSGHKGTVLNAQNRR